MGDETNILEVNGHIATITFNREPANAWSLAALEDFEQKLNKVESDKNVRVVILTGAGKKCFSAGFDVKDGANADKTGPKGQELWSRIDKFEKPFIAAINGHAFGGGLELTLCCHFRIMADSPKAQIGLTELNLGIIPGWGGTQRLIREVGRAKALDMILFSKRLSAAEALEAGLVHQIVPPEKLMDEAASFSQKLSERPPVAVGCVLRAMSAGIYEGIEQRLTVEREGSRIAGSSKDAAEGFNAFLEKRQPVFKGEYAEPIMNTDAAILVAEDVKSSRVTLVRMLSKLGFSEVYEAGTGKQTLERLKNTRIDLVLLDVIMPEMDGHQVLKTMKADVNLRQIPVIMVTAVDNMASAVTCIKRGAEEYLTKPFNPVMLRARIFASLEKKRLQDIEKEYLKMYDSATGLPNQRYFLQRLTEQIHRSDRQPSLFAVLCVQIGKYNMIFESLGRKAANQYLENRAGQLKSLLPDDALLARTGEQTFAVLLFDLPPSAKGNATAISIYKALSSPVNLAGHEITGRVNVGVVYNNPPYKSAEIMFRDSGLAASRAGLRGGFKIFDDTLHQEAMRRLALEPDLRRALNNHQFLVYYQPIVHIGNGNLAGYEALARWIHPEKGMIMPDGFISMAEDTGLIIPLGNWILYEVCRQAAKWEKKADKTNNFTISVNVSAHQFTDPNFLSVLQAAFEQTGASSRHICLELTETSLIENAARLTEILNELARINVRTSLDDFGKGYCSLNYLNRFPFDTLKIDKSLIHCIYETPRNQAIVGSTIELAHRLEMNVIAEGLEEHREVETLRDMGCEYGQGWFYSEPLPEKQAGKLLW